MTAYSTAVAPLPPRKVSVLAMGDHDVQSAQSMKELVSGDVAAQLSGTCRPQTDTGTPGEADAKRRDRPHGSPPLNGV